MLRLKILASTVPLAIAAFLARGEFFVSTHPCIAAGDGPVQIAAFPWQAQSHVSFTDDPASATVRVQIVESAENADFTVIDDDDSNEPGVCKANAATRFVGITTSPASTDPVIYLSDSGEADYRIFVRSRSFTARNAAALIVGAHNAPPARMAAASL
ncbi:hypothetical protein E0H22_01430 [Rhodopseudomonas boonkerdii]|uniref:hypothetical protein n=1 Tax=Rhodopseudomonas boonkerdii TaxID=475937 RepID=UPI001E3BB0FD|nr:hypothetical protein [Rhodopseudomonas boonkerdii]UGV28764.1 hypothetical protein E0H22_01430 [Rhodopseudomonas boonkerdii]